MKLHVVYIPNLCFCKPKLRGGRSMLKLRDEYILWWHIFSFLDSNITEQFAIDGKKQGNTWLLVIYSVRWLTNHLTVTRSVVVPNWTVHYSGNFSLLEQSISLQMIKVRINPKISLISAFLLKQSVQMHPIWRNSQSICFI